MKRLALTIALLAGVIGLTNATDNDPKTEKADNLTALSPEEIALETALEAELDINVEQVIAELMEQPSIEGIKIFDLNGNVVCEQTEKIDPDKIPYQAELVMTEKGIQYYVIVE